MVNFSAQIGKKEPVDLNNVHLLPHIDLFRLGDQFAGEATHAGGEELEVDELEQPLQMEGVLEGLGEVYLVVEGIEEDYVEFPLPLLSGVIICDFALENFDVLGAVIEVKAEVLDEADHQSAQALLAVRIPQLPNLVLVLNEGDDHQKDAERVKSVQLGIVQVVFPEQRAEKEVQGLHDRPLV